MSDEAIISGDYISNTFSTGTLKKTIKRVKQVLLPLVNTFDTIAFRGMSGALVAPSIAAKLEKDVILVRKQGASHSSRICEGRVNAKRYVIIDDFVEYGTTVLNIISEIKKWQEQYQHTMSWLDETAKDFPLATCVGMVFYLHGEDTMTQRYKDLAAKLPYEIPCIRCG